MKIEIWSDIMCPFCYIGKRHLEAALEAFPQKEKVEIEWKSFQLDPDMPHLPGVSVIDYLAKAKGISREESVAMHDRVVAMAAEAGLEYRFDKAVPANSFDAHKIIQMAKERGRGDEAEELFFKGYFTEGLDMQDEGALVTLGGKLGFSAEEVKEAIHSDELAYAVRSEIAEAAQLGIRGVPFFVIDRKYGISGAQPVEVFAQALHQAIGVEGK